MASTFRQRPSVLVVGAGPVGLVAAIRLRLHGITVRVVDAESSANKRTYPVVLHPRTLRLLTALGVTTPLKWRGRVINHLVVYADNLKRVVLDLPPSLGISPGAMTLPQDVLRQALTQRLSALGTEVEWQTRLVALAQDGGGVRVELIHRERVEGIAPELKAEWLDVAAETIDAELVLGTDGRSSTVRKALGIELVQRGEPETYVFYDATDPRAGDEAHLVIAGGYASSVYPLHGGLSRFSFRIAPNAPHAPGVLDLGRLLAERLPWYAAVPGAHEWSGTADFQPALAERFGDGRVWLAGDAAHCTGPLGGQSLNVGLQEAHDLALRIADRPSGHQYPLGSGYDAERRAEWERLLGPSPPNLRAPAWVLRNARQLFAALPVSGDDLDDILEQLRARSA